MLPLQRIVVATDFSPVASAALQAATGLAARAGEPEVVLLHAVEPMSFLEPLTGARFTTGVGLPSDIMRRSMENAEERLAEFAGEAPIPEPEDLGRVVRSGRPADAILELGDELDADLLVVGTHGRTGVRRLLFGSVAGEVLRRARRPVMTVHEWVPGADGPLIPGADGALVSGVMNIRRVLVPTDFSKQARAGLRAGVEIARAFGAELHLLHVIDTRFDAALAPLLGDHQPSLQSLLARAEKHAEDILASEWKAAGPSSLTTKEHVRVGQPAHEVAEFVKGYEIDMIVMGSRGRSTIGDFILGSTAERINRTSTVPVITVREEAEAAD